MPKLRADLALHARGLAESREAAQRLIAAGRVRAGTLVLVKASQMVAEDAELVVSEPERYVSRGGLKLEGALSAFAIDPTGRACLDLGASTGGFTDCLLQHGAASVLAVDVGRAQLHQRLREDPRVTLLEGTNARNLPELAVYDRRLTIGAPVQRDTDEQAQIANRQSQIRPHPAPFDHRLTIDAPVQRDTDEQAQIANRQSQIRPHPVTHDHRLTNDAPVQRDTDEQAKIANRQSQITPLHPETPTINGESTISLFVADLSFISLRKVLPSVAHRLAPGTEGVVLLKPQFEAGPKDVPRGGVIKDAAVLERVRREFLAWLGDTGWHVYGMIASPIRGGDGNTEYLVHLRTPITMNGEARTASGNAPETVQESNDTVVRRSSLDVPRVGSS